MSSDMEKHHRVAEVVSEQPSKEIAKNEITPLVS